MVRRPGGLLGTIARTAVVAGTATAVSGAMGRRQDRRAQEQVLAQQQEAEQQAAQQQAYAQQAAAQYAPPPAPAQQQDDLVSRIQELSRLHEAGALSDAEFSAAKTKLLGG
ncbi:hypothetical protein Afil01_20680 [Actinorhabdospora filicis]|uniref:SHOCT domain-containing protein n=1 Tax=Actinorhabdospora filicis TaxID=1785913 RepID=A0A9W6SMF0_9ACTN|nr:hypothetical protein Afil01_20680 [Actinorhabdospora filicis]